MSSRRLAQFGLRAIFVLIFLSALASFWLRAKLNSFAAEESAAEQITRVGAQVRLETARPEWFWSLFRPVGKHSQYIVDIEINDLQVSGEIVKLIGALDRLNRIRLDLPADFPDDALAPLLNLTSLKVVSIGGPTFSDAGLATLQNSRGIEHLTFGGARITDQGIGVLSRFPRLADLSFSQVSISDTGFLPVLELKQLCSVTLPRTLSAISLQRLAALPRLRGIETSMEIDDEEGLAEIWRLRELRQVRLRGPGITDRTIKDLSMCRSLVRLEIEGAPNITDNCFEYLANAPALEHLSIRRAPISSAGVVKLRRAPRLNGMRFRDTRVKPLDYSGIHAELPRVNYVPSF